MPNWVFKEKYGSSGEERCYLRKHPNSLVLKKIRMSVPKSVLGYGKKIFLPQGYPKSVSTDYLEYQKWDTIQAFSSTIMGILSTHEVLRGVGVGDNKASILSATLTWVFRDGCGHLSRILFAFLYGSYLDAYSKKWRLCADILNDVAMCIEMGLSLFQGYTTLALCLSTSMKAIVGVAGGATRVAMTQHHAVRGNIGDVAAKDSAQETAANLIALVTALFFLSVFGNSLMLFIIMMLFHITCNYLAVRAICLKTLNEPRFCKVIDMYLNNHHVPSPYEANKSERIFYPLGQKICGMNLRDFQIKIGVSLTCLKDFMSGAEKIQNIVNIYRKYDYIIFYVSKKKQVLVILKENHAHDAILRAYYHAVLMATVICSITNQNSDKNKIVDCLRQFGVDRNFFYHRPALHYEPSYEFMQFICGMVTFQWPFLKNGLEKTGWDLSKNLIIADDWRLSNNVGNVDKYQ